MGPELTKRIFCHNIIYGNDYFTWIESTRPKQMLRRPMAAITTRVRCSIFPSLSNNDDEEDDDDCWRLMITRTTLHFWCLTHKNQTGRKTEIWKWLTYKNIGQRTCHIDGSGSSEDFSLLGVEESIDHSEIHFMLCHVTWVLCRWWRGPYSVFWFQDNGGKNF